MNTQKMKIGDIKPYEKNPRKNTKAVDASFSGEKIKSDGSALRYRR
jgi:hypothetical protein